MTVNEIIDTLIDRRHQKGLTQQDLSSLTGLTQSVIARFENKKNIPQLNTILKISTALDCNVVVVPKENANDSFFVTPNMKDTIIDGLNTPISECLSEDKVKW